MARASVARLARRFQGPTDHPPAERVEHDRQEGKLLGKPNIGDVRDPELIDAGRHQVRHHTPFMARVGRDRHKRTLAQTQQIVLPHQPQHAFVVHHKAVATQLRCDPPVAITAVGQHHALDRVASRGLFLAWC
jgi:hypothetical protein